MAKTKCPKCSKTVLGVREYKDGRKLYIHAQKITRVAGIGFIEITDSCMVKA
jgi:hypothetical protein